jgi:hypothetical protein
MPARQCLLVNDRVRPYMSWRINIRSDADIVQHFDGVVLRAISSANGAAEQRASLLVSSESDAAIAI